MAKRLHEADKWDDKWFRSLKPNEKLVFLFLIDKCDLAGFYEVDLEDMRFRIGLNIEEIELTFQGLNRGIIGAKNSGWVWVKNFIKQQKNLPLNILNNAHKHIVQKIKDQQSRFSEVKEFKEFYERELGAVMGPNSPIGIGIDTGKGKGKGKVNVIGLDFGENTETINLLWRKVYKTLPGIVEADFIRELLDKFGVEKTELIIKNFRSNGFNNISTMRRSLDNEGNIKPKNESQDNHKGLSYDEAILQNKGKFKGWNKKEDGLWYKN